jgi:hypothetical protein
MSYLLICAGCDPAGDTPLPFGTPEGREQYRLAHVGASGLDGQPHLAFTYYDQPPAPPGKTGYQAYRDQRAGITGVNDLGLST